MILRKPYAFLIKNFKLIHFILCALMFYLTYQTTRILKYIKTFINSVTAERLFASNYISWWMFFAIILILFISIVVYFLMRYKKKPKTIYFINIIGYLGVFVVFIYAYNILSTLEIKLLDQRSLILARDILNMTFIYQGIIAFLMLVRALGFDIKKFNFAEDLNELNIDVSDNEEFELVVGVDTDKILRKVRKKKRLFKYFILENKFMFIIISSFLTLTLTTYLILNTFVYKNVYKENQQFRGNKFIFNIASSYITNTSYNNKNISLNDTTYVVVRYNFKMLNDSFSSLNPNDFKLIIGDHIYSINNKLCSDFYDLGSCYKEEYYKEEKDYVLIFNIPKKDQNKKMVLRYLDTLTYKIGSFEAKYKNVEITPRDLTEKTKEDVKSLGEELNFTNSLFTGITLKIDNYNLANKFDYTYTSCLNGKCSDYAGLITSTGSSLNEKTILKIDLNYQNSLNNISSSKFITDFGIISYEKNNVTYNVNYTNVTPSNYQGSSLYLEVDRNLSQAEHISFIFNIRNKEYHYKIK